MKHNYLSRLSFAFMVAFLLLSNNLKAQHYEQFGVPMGLGLGDYGYYNNYGDTVAFMFTNIPDGAYANSYISVFFYGDDGDMGENVDVYTDGIYLGNRAENLNGDCAPEDSVAMAIPFAVLNSYITDDTLIVLCLPSINVDFFCGQTTLRCKLIFDYCIFGTPSPFASFTASDSVLCAYESPVNLVGTPTGGTYSGTGVSGNTFNPAGLLPGNYPVTYTATDSIGCITSATKNIKILNAPVVSDYLICRYDSATFTPSTGYEYVWYSQPNYTGVIDTTIGPLSYGPFNSPTTLYVANTLSGFNYRVDSILTTNVVFAEIDVPLAGDDNGGIAVTDSFVFVNGDDNVARFDLDLNPGSAVTFPVTDGIYSDLATGQLLSLCSDNIGTLLASGDATIGSIRNLNSDMTLASYTPLSMVIPITGNFNMVLAGAGAVGIFSNANSHFYVIENTSGNVTDYGVVSNLPNFNFSENWASWGILEYDGIDYSILYKDDNYSPATIVRHQMPGGLPVIHTTFPSDMSDMASFTFHHNTNKWYFHYENGSGTFSNVELETLGYADGMDTLSTIPGGVGCYSSFDVNMNLIDLGNDTVVCSNQTPVILEAGNGYVSYTWNGVNNNWNIFPVTSSGQYIVDAVDNIGCHVIDTATVTVNACLGIEENDQTIASVFPNPSNGNFTVQMESLQSGMAEVEVLDLQGRKLFSKIIEVSASVNNIPVSLIGVMDGIYLVNIRLNDHQQNFRMIIKQ
jgi:hypothetical protein